MYTNDIKTLAAKTKGTYEVLDQSVTISKSPSLLWDYPPDEKFRRSRDLKKQVLRYVDQHSRAANQELAHRIATLPQELRDMIYTHTWLGLSPKHLETSQDPGDRLISNSVPLLHKTCPGPPCRCMIKLPHFVDLNFMGAQVAREMLLHFPMVTTPEFLKLSLLEVAGPEMKAFMRKDAFHVGLTMDTIFKSVGLRLSIGDLHAWEHIREVPKIRAWGRGQDEVQEAADALMEFADSARTSWVALKGCARTVTIALDDNFRTLQELETLISAFGPSFIKLHRRGFATCLDFHIKSEMKYGLADEAWTWPTERWEEELRHGNAYSWWRLFDARPTSPVTEEEIQWQKLRWELIMRHMYQVDVTTV